MAEPRKIYRYPAVNPFSEEQSMLFFGRVEETKRLAALIFSEKLTVLYGKSGYGKSSLLNAGILPRLKEKTDKGEKVYIPIPIRFQSAEKEGQTLFEKFAFQFRSAVQLAGIQPINLELPSLPDTLWSIFKNLKPVENSVFVLLFDQFEEFFTYPTEQQDEFKEQLSELLYTSYPAYLRENRRQLSQTPEVYEFLGKDIDVRAVFAIREDRLSELDNLSDRLPDILRKRMQLNALSAAQARDAIIRPARFGSAPEEQAMMKKAGLQFYTPTFEYDNEAVEIILDHLTEDDGENIESSFLQFVCFSNEKKVEKEGISRIQKRDLPDFKQFYEAYFNTQLAEISDEEIKQAARHILEFGLLFVNEQTGEAHRRSVDELELSQSFNASAGLLHALEKTYLIRREVNSFGRYSYEISHDTLVNPILRNRRASEAETKRIEVERRARDAEEKALEEKKRARNARRLALVAVLVALIAIISGFIAYSQYKQAQEAKEKAIQKEHDANQKLFEALVEKKQRLEIEMANAERALSTYQKAGHRRLIEETEQLLREKTAEMEGVKQDIDLVENALNSDQ